MRRTDTTTVNTFHLAAPAAVTMTFLTPSQQAPSTQVILISIPDLDGWKMPFHWHTSKTQDRGACDSVKCLSGHLVLTVSLGLDQGYTIMGSKNSGEEFTPDARVWWGRTPTKLSKDHSPLEVELKADDILWRNYCSATLDRDIFPHLDTTPLLVKALFAMLGAIPAWRNKLLDAMLWVQVQTIFYAHDFHLYRGYVPVTWPWVAQPFGGRPPEWAKRLQVGSMYFIARVVITAAYWLGRLGLGMQGRYAEYTPTRETSVGKFEYSQ